MPNVFCVIYLVWRERDGRRNVGGISARSGNGDLSRKGCVVDG